MALPEEEQQAILIPNKPCQDTCDKLNLPDKLNKTLNKLNNNDKAYLLSRDLSKVSISYDAFENKIVELISTFMVNNYFPK